MKILDLKQGTEEWKLARMEKISGTRLADAVGTKVKQEALLNILIAEALTSSPKELYANGAMEHGMEAENYAVDEYESKSGNLTEQVGLCVSEKYPWLVNSPDRLIKIDGKYKKAVEIKSPNTDTAVKYIRKGGIPKEYEGQVISYFLVNEDLEELDFVVYDPRIKNDQYRMTVTTVKRTDFDLAKIEEKLLAFYEIWQTELTRLNLTF